jgi:D-alanine-D-alanine ligase-like ATP-grasp enzyme
MASDFIIEAAREIGLEVFVEPDWGYAGYLVMPDGARSYFRNQHVALNRLGAAEVAKDKDQTSHFLAERGFRVVEGRAFFAPRWAKQIGSDQVTTKAYKYAETLGLPVLVKPNSRSQGQAVSVAYTRSEFGSAVGTAARADRVVLVQRYVVGRDYRLVVLDSEVISAYERLPLRVIGDGRSTVLELAVALRNRFTASGRDMVLDFRDYRITRRLARSGLELGSVPAAGQGVQLLDTANLSTGGSAIDVTGLVHADYRELAIEATRAMGLRLAGLDLIAGRSLDEPIGLDHWILELNASPGLDNYASIGAMQLERVRDLYGRVVRALVAERSGPDSSVVGT